MFGKRIPKFVFGGYNRGKMQVDISTWNKMKSAIMHFRKCNGDKKYGFGEEVKYDDLGDIIAEIVFLDIEDMKLLGEQLIRAYRSMKEEQNEV